MDVTDTLATFVSEFDLRTVESDVLEAAKVMVLDGLGVMIAGAGHPAIRILRQYADDVGGREEATIIGLSRRTNPPLAAYVNGAALHVLDYEIQGHVPGHGTSNILPPALAVAEKMQVGGSRVIGAVITGWEVNARLRQAGPLVIGGFHPPGAIGPIGAAAASGYLLGLTTHQMKMAFGIAASRASGLSANRGSMVKSTHPGNAGRMGAEAAMLAKLGFESNEDIFGAPTGYVSTMFWGEFDEAILSEGLSKARYLVDPSYSIKFYPAEVWMQRIIQSISNIRAEHDIDLNEVDYVEVEIARILPEVSRPQPTSGLDGKFSYEYCAAAALTQDHVGIRTFTDEVRFSPPIELILPKVRLVENPSIPEGVEETWVVGRVALKDGRTFESKCEAFRGQPRNPMSRTDRVTKFTDCAAQYLGSDDVTAAIIAVEHLEEEGSLEEVVRVIRAVELPQ